MKSAVFVLSDPKGGAEESLGRLFNALVLAKESKRHGDEVALVFAGAGTRWPGALAAPGHPARALYDEVRDVVAGASCACADVWGASEDVEASGVPLLKDDDDPASPGPASVRRYAAEGWSTFVF
ncbi:MAG: hypothetical protein ACF8XB_25580 [Planctomycetota bacterium JB042]